MSALTFKVSGDSSGLMRSLDGAKGALSGLANMGRRLAIGGALAGAAAGVAGLALSYRGLKDALDLGGRLSDVAANTGLTAGEAMVMERAFSDAGLSGEKLQGTITKMQKSIVEGRDGLMTYRRAFEGIGLSVDDLAGMSPAEQFKAIQSALSGMSDPAERSARAMQIFGRSGAELGALFSNSGAMAQAAESVGDQAAIMDKSAAAFDRSSDLLGGMGKKIQGFFVGMASSVNSVLLPVLEEMNKVDFAKIGEEVGTAVAMIVEAFGENRIGEILANSLMIAGKSFMNFLINGFLGLAKMVAAMFSEVRDVLAGQSEGGSVEGAVKLGGTAVDALGLMIAKIIPESLGGLTQEERRAGDLELGVRDAAAREMIKGGLGDLTWKLLTAMSDQLGQEGVFGVSEEKESIKRIVETLNQALIDRKAAQEEESKKKENKKEEEKKGIDRDPVRLLAPVISSLGRVGGAGAGSLIPQSLDIKRNELLKDIAGNTRAMRSASVAVYG